MKFSTRAAAVEPTSSIVPTRTRTMLRMKASAVIRKARMSPAPAPVHSAAKTSRSKRTWSVWVGVKAVKSWRAGQGGRAGRRAPRGRARCGHQSARPRSNGLGARRAAGAGRGSCARWRRGGRRSRRRPRVAAVTATSSGQHAVQAPRQVVGRRRRGTKLATWPRAWTPASVRPATVSVDRLAQDRRPAPSRARPAPCAGPAAAPSRENSVPSYSMSSRTVVTGGSIRARERGAPRAT